MTPEVLDQLVKSGLTTQQLADVVKVWLASQPKRSTEAERAARYRARKAERDAVTTHHDERDEITPVSSPSPPKKFSPYNPLTKITPSTPPSEIDSGREWDFERFWRVYPRRVARAQAKRKFDVVAKSGVVSWQRFMLGADLYAQHCRAYVEPQFIKHPATWIGGHCWADELVAPSTGPPRTTGKPLTYAQSQREQLREIRDGLKNFASGSGDGGTGHPCVLPADTGERSAPFCGGTGGVVIDVSPSGRETGEGVEWHSGKPGIPEFGSG